MATQAAKGIEKGSEAVLLVEDEELVRITAKRILERYGYRVFAASTADEAKVLFRDFQEEITLLFTDFVMPGTNGKELFLQLLGQRPDLKVLFMSGYPEEVINHCNDLSPSHNFIQKPFSPQGLTQKVREVLDS